MELSLPVLSDFEVRGYMLFAPHSANRAVPSVSGSRGIRFAHISQSPNVYGCTKIFERLGGEISGQHVPHKIGQIVQPYWYRKIDAAIR